MAHKVIFTSDGKINGKKVKEGTERSVSASIFKDLTEVQKCVEEVVEEVVEEEVEEVVEEKAPKKIKKKK